METKCSMCNKNVPTICEDCYNSLDNQFDLLVKDVAGLIGNMAAVISDVKQDLEGLLKEKKDGR